VSYHKGTKGWQGGRGVYTRAARCRGFTWRTHLGRSSSARGEGVPANFESPVRESRLGKLAKIPGSGERGLTLRENLSKFAQRLTGRTPGKGKSRKHQLNHQFYRKKRGHYAARNVEGGGGIPSIFPPPRCRVGVYESVAKKKKSRNRAAKE